MTEPIKELASPLVIAVANQKGGTGKTTSTINLAAGLRACGIRTLVIDMDQQCNATTGLAIDPDTAQRTVYELFLEKPQLRCSVMDAAVETRWGVFVVPGSTGLIEVEKRVDDTGIEYRLAKQLQDIPPMVVLIDCPPNLGRCTTMSLVAADVVIAPVRPGPDELEALARLEETIEKLHADVNPRLVLGGVLTSEFAGSSELHKGMRKRLADRYGDRYLGEVAKTVRVGEAKGKRTPLVIDQPSSTAAEDFMAIARKLADRIAA
uniref:ParA family protein n=1 Tax=Amycolatopsis sp. CA-290885 TaxID=3239925 RepID=UPI003F4959B9